MRANVRKAARRRTGARPGVRGAWCASIVTCACLLVPASAVHGAAPEGLRRDVVFEHGSRLARNGVLGERLLTPLLADAAARRLREAGGSADDPVLDLAQERFAVYVPSGPEPAAGYGLLVFVPPWEGQALPRGWLPVLERAGMIAVTAARAGNAQNVLGRRVPLALAAYENVARAHRIDPRRVYVGGFSGGARVALRVALGFPDIFRGALLNAGSDPLGSPAVPLPSAELFERFSRGTRLVYASGTRDLAAAGADRHSLASARTLCVEQLVELPIRGGTHEPADARTFARALRELDAPRAERRDGTTCRLARDAALHDALEQVATQVDAGHDAAAARALAEVDAKYGGLAAPRSRELAARLRVRGVDTDESATSAADASVSRVER